VQSSSFPGYLNYSQQRLMEYYVSQCGADELDILKAVCGKIYVACYGRDANMTLYALNALTANIRACFVPVPVGADGHTLHFLAAPHDRIGRVLSTIDGL
jgi:hypothetical protein